MKDANPQSRGQKIQFLVKVLFLTCRWMPLTESSPRLFSVCMEGDRDRDREIWCHFLFLEGHQSFCLRAPSLLSHLTLVISLKSLSPNTVILGVTASTHGFKGHKFNPWQHSLEIARVHIIKTILKKNEVERLTLPDFKSYYNKDSVALTQG